MNAHVWSGCVHTVFFLINCTVICLSNKEMHRCVNFLADFII